MLDEADVISFLVAADRDRMTGDPRRSIAEAKLGSGAAVNAEPAPAGPPAPAQTPGLGTVALTGESQDSRAFECRPFIAP